MEVPAGSVPEGLTLSNSGGPRPLSIDALRALAPNRVVLGSRGYVIEAKLDREKRALVNVRHLAEEAWLDLGGPEPIRLGEEPAVISSVGSRILLGTKSGRLLATDPCN